MVRKNEDYKYRSSQRKFLNQGIGSKMNTTMKAIKTIYIPLVKEVNVYLAKVQKLNIKPIKLGVMLVVAIHSTHCTILIATDTNGH
ncbi:hypothetical protein BFP77_10600 [Maribacter sp. 4U21]|nr:hypothetical protein BFP77_10600 [Maribacter sp. 4U21]